MSVDKCLLIVQARLGSTRLPRKVLKEINGISLLEILMERICLSKKVDEFIIATTDEDGDKELYDFGVEKGWKIIRGSEWDVLDRFHKAANCTSEQPGVIIRITGDCPLHDHKVIDWALEQFEGLEVDYFSNSDGDGNYIEDGFDVEVFKYSALEKAWKEANMLSEREHVTPYMRNSGKFKCSYGSYVKTYNYKLSVDSQEDFNVVARIIKELSGSEEFGMEEVIDLLKEKPEILELNKKSVINSGYDNSLKNDRNVK